MARTYKLLLFYVAVLLAAVDLWSLGRRFVLVAPDPLAWDKVLFAVALQAAAFAVAWPLLVYIARVREPQLEKYRSLFSALDLRLVPLLVLGLVSAFSAMVFFNGVNCGKHPLPTNKGMAVCPR